MTTLDDVLKHLITDSTSRAQLATMLGSIYADVLIDAASNRSSPDQIDSWDDIVKMACKELLEKTGEGA